MLVKIPITTYTFILLYCVIAVAANYWSDRASLVRADETWMGFRINLTEAEDKANEILKKYKFAEYDQGLSDKETFLAAQHFFKAKSGIEQSKVFDILRKLPKGASLHAHDLGLVSEEYLLNLTYKEHLYGCVSNRRFIMHFFAENNVSNICNWTLLSKLRAQNPKFDQFLLTAISLKVDDPINFYPTELSVWEAFRSMFGSVINLVTYRPVWLEYFFQALQELYDDNVRYLEFRTVLPQVYDLDGNIYDDEEVVGLYYESLQLFKLAYPDFIGARMIYAPSRKVDNISFDEYIIMYQKLATLYPDFIAGFDLVGQEDLGYPLEVFVSQLLRLKSLGVKFFFHAGETNWYGTTTDMNLFDAVLLNTTRIGHGYAILKHPVIAQKVKDQKIAIEISPISNQVLKLVDDVRNHPGAVMIANDFPVVITNDDPSFWGAKALSYDWYYAFMAMASREADLRFLKQLAMNSLLYSSMNANEKDLALSQWRKDWEEFIHNLLVEHNQV